jgi:hypothetical protein
MKKILIFLFALPFAALASCPDGDFSRIEPNSYATGKMPYEITLNFTSPWASFFRVNPYGNAEVFRFDISTDQGKQIYAMLLASKSQCKTLRIYTGNNRSDNDGYWVEIKKIVLE